MAAQDWGEVFVPRRITPLRGTRQIDLGGVSVELTALPGTAHTPGDVLVRLPEDRILFAGDVIWGRITPLAVSGSITGWLDQLDRIARWETHRIVPGHGPVGRSELIHSTRQYLDWVLELARQEIAGTGLSERVIEQQRASREWADWACPERDLVNVACAVADLTGRRFDPVAAIAAMIQRLGGPLVLAP